MPHPRSGDRRQSRINMMIDFHSHILPGIDDGSPSAEISIAMLRMAAEQGISQVVATPHFYPHRDDPVRFLKRRDRAEAALREEMERYPGLPGLYVGAETAFFRGISQSDYLRWLTIREKGCILIEMPPAPWPEEYYRELTAIWEKRGIVPIIAHIDRYIGPFRTFGIPKRLAGLPVCVQANADFFLDRGTRNMALRMLRAEQIDLLGSDCHNLSDRKPNLGPALDQIRRHLGDEPLQRLRNCGASLLARSDQFIFR